MTVEERIGHAILAGWQLIFGGGIPTMPSSGFSPTHSLRYRLPPHHPGPVGWQTVKVRGQFPDETGLRVEDVLLDAAKVPRWEPAK